MKLIQPNTGLCSLYNMKKHLALLFILTLATYSIRAQTLTIEFTNIRNNKGQLLLGIYTNQDDYAKEKAIKKLTVYKTEVKNGKISTKVEGLTPGTYGIALLDDEDFDREMTYGLILPKEGFAFSDYYHKGMSRPTFHDFDFNLGKEDKTVTMKIRYL